YAQALLHLLCGRIERLGRLYARPDLVALRFGSEEQQERGPGLEQVAVLQQAFGKDHRLVVPGWVGEADDTHAIAGLGAALDARDHRRCHAARGGAGFHGLAEIRPRLDPQTLEQRRIVVERMAGEKEADRVVFLLQPL